MMAASEIIIIRVILFQSTFYNYSDFSDVPLLIHVEGWCVAKIADAKTEIIQDRNVKSCKNRNEYTAKS